MPQDQEIERSQCKSKPGLEGDPRAVHDLLEMTDAGQHREHGLDQHPGIPGAPSAQLEIGRIALFAR